MNPIVYDILIAIFVVLATLRGKKRGFVLTLCGLLTVFVACIGAGIAASVLAAPVAAVLQPLVEQAILSALENVPADPIQVPLAAVLDAMHSQPILSSMADAFQSALDAGVVEMAGGAVAALAGYAAVQIARILLFILAFAAIVVVWWFISHALDLAFHLPGLNFLNRFGGLFLGFVQGVALVFILCWLLKDSYLTPEVINGSYLLPFFCSENPLLYISILNS